MSIPVTKQHRDTLPQNMSFVKLAKNYESNLIDDPLTDGGSPATTQGIWRP